MKGYIPTALAIVALAVATSALACEDMKKAEANAAYGLNASQKPIVLACEGDNCPAMPTKAQDANKAVKKPVATKKANTIDPKKD